MIFYFFFLPIGSNVTVLHATVLDSNTAITVASSEVTIQQAWIQRCSNGLLINNATVFIYNTEIYSTPTAIYILPSLAVVISNLTVVDTNAMTVITPSLSMSDINIRDFVTTYNTPINLVVSELLILNNVKVLNYDNKFFMFLMLTILQISNVTLSSSVSTGVHSVLYITSDIETNVMLNNVHIDNVLVRVIGVSPLHMLT